MGQEQRRGKEFCYPNAFYNPLTLYGVWGKNSRVEMHFATATHVAVATHIVNTLWVVGQEQRRGKEFCYPNAFCHPLTLYGVWGKNSRVEMHFATATHVAVATHSVNTLWVVGQEQRCGKAFCYPNAFYNPLTNCVTTQRILLPQSTKCVATQRILLPVHKLGCDCSCIAFRLSGNTV